MTFLGGVILLVLLLGAQAGLNQVWPGAPEYVDFLLLPPVWYGLSRSQRSAMIAGSAAGLLRDIWFRASALGIGGFSGTVVGFLVGAVGTRIDLNNSGARLLVGAGAALIDSTVTLLLLRLLDLDSVMPGVGATLLRALTTGVLTVWGFMLYERFRNNRLAQGRY